MKSKPVIGDTRIKRIFLFFLTPNIFGDKEVFLEFRTVLQIYDEYDGIPRWRTLYYIDEEN